MGAAPRRGGSGFAPTSKRSADCRMRCWHFILPSPVRLRQRCWYGWDNYPISVSAAKTARFVRCFTVTRERYTVTLRNQCRHPHFYRHPSQTKVNRRFLNFGCRHGQQFLSTAGFRFYCHPTGRKSAPVFALRDFFEL